MGIAHLLIQPTRATTRATTTAEAVVCQQPSPDGPHGPRLSHTTQAAHAAHAAHGSPLRSGNAPERTPAGAGADRPSGSAGFPIDWGSATGASRTACLADLYQRYHADIHHFLLHQLRDGSLATKLRKSQSQRTRATYETTLASYRATLHQAGLDLDSADTTTLKTLLEGWAAKR